jgi:hypothetical protein
VKRGVVNPDITQQRILEREGLANLGAYDYQLKTGLESYGVFYEKADGIALWDDIMDEVARNRPIIIFYQWAGGLDGHFMVIGGWEFVKPIRWVYLHDPLEAAEKRVSYDRLVAGNYAPGGHREEGGTWAYSMMARL